METVLGRRLGITGVAVLASLLVVAGDVEAQCQYEVTIIQAPECPWPFGFPATFGTGLNERGHVVGFYSHCGGEPGYEAFIWTPESGLVTLPRPPGVWSSTASDLNDAGVIVGTYTVTGIGDRGYFYQDGKFTELPPVVDVPGAWSSAAAISNDNIVVGQRSIRVDTTPQNAYIWSAGKGFTDLGVMQGGASRATDVSEVGHVVGSTGGLAVPGQEGFLWQDGKITLLGAVPQGISSWAIAVNSHGSIAGGGLMDPEKSPDIFAQPALWENGQWLLLGLLPGCGAGGAGDTNDARAVVGVCGSLSSPIPLKPFLWQDGLIHDLNDLIQPDSGILLKRAFAICNAGQIIADGNDRNNDHVTFILTPIQPLGDLDGDCRVGILDLLSLLVDWGESDSAADLDNDGVVGLLDLLILLANWG